MCLSIVISISVLLSSTAFADLYGKGKGLSKGNTEESSEEDKNTDAEKDLNEDKDTKTLLPKAVSPSKNDSKEDNKSDAEKETKEKKDSEVPMSTVAPAVEKELEEDKISDQETYDFKKFHWGDSLEHVIEIEGEPDGDGEMTEIKSNYIVYDTTVAGKSALLAYYFCDEGLWQTRYVLTESHTNEDLYIDDYETLKTQLTKKFGDPLLDLESWQDDGKEERYKDKKGDALSYGYLTYWTWYQTDTTDIDLDMSADNFYISTSINFASLKITPDEPDYSDDF